MSRFVMLSRPTGESRFANLRERLEEPLPGESAVLAPVSERLATMRAQGDNSSKRLPAFRTAKPAAQVKPLAKVASGPTAAELAQVARREANARFDNVMRSDAVKGREQQANELLLASCDRNARFPNSTAIIAELKARPLDRDLKAAKPTPSAKTTAAADGVWDRAWAKVSAGRGRPSPTAATAEPTPEPKGPWEKAEAIIAAQRRTPTQPNAKAQAILADQRAYSGKAAGERTPEKIWERAYRQPKVLPGY